LTAEALHLLTTRAAKFIAIVCCGLQCSAGVDITGQIAIDTGYGIFRGDNTSFTTIPAPVTAIALMTLPFLAMRRRN
jgi:hypothetical protein